MTYTPEQIADRIMEILDFCPTPEEYQEIVNILKTPLDELKQAKVDISWIRYPDNMGK